MNETYTPPVSWRTEEDSTLLDAIVTYGQQEQEMMAVGEIGEFLTVFGRRAQGRLTVEEMIDEIADVTIMMRQMAHINGLRAVEDRIRFKVERLAGKLARHKA
jgi:hypothetical protein